MILLDRIIRASTDEGTTILTHFWVWNTSVAAVLKGGETQSIEQDEEYCELAKKN
ncbi:MAG: hypothetical protein CM15mP26_2660 [Actinomycetota bacterium]|nr:MAG: hypothetical protein CM15mP26_2660 [Actinomycetota bacterium]